MLNCTTDLYYHTTHCEQLKKRLPINSAISEGNRVYRKDNHVYVCV